MTDREREGFYIIYPSIYQSTNEDERQRNIETTLQRQSTPISRRSRLQSNSYSKKQTANVKVA